ncbi:hypothetical protein ACLB2K_027128 [Fragaria x ananassa]
MKEPPWNQSLTFFFLRLGVDDTFLLCKACRRTAARKDEMDDRVVGRELASGKTKGRKMGFGGIRLCLSLLLAFAILSSASRNTIHPFSVSVSDNDEMVMRMERRYLMARLNDYDDPTANRGHDPPSVSKAKPRKVGGRKG